MSVDVWGDYLASHPNRVYCNYLVHGLREGFRIGFRYGSSLCRSASVNMQSAEVRPDIISGFLLYELRGGRVLGLIEPEVAASVHHPS